TASSLEVNVGSYAVRPSDRTMRFMLYCHRPPARPPRLESALPLRINSSSSMISRHSSIHSSQMYTPPGPAISLRTSSWLLPQNEQRYSDLLLLPGLNMLFGLLLLSAGRGRAGDCHPERSEGSLSLVLSTGEQN